MLTNASKRTKRSALFTSGASKHNDQDMPVGPEEYSADESERRSSESATRLSISSLRALTSPREESLSKHSSPLGKTTKDAELGLLDMRPSSPIPIPKVASPPPTINFEIEHTQFLSPTAFECSKETVETLSPSNEVAVASCSAPLLPAKPTLCLPLRQKSRRGEALAAHLAEYIPRRASGDHWKMRKISKQKSTKASDHDSLPASEVPIGTPMPGTNLPLEDPFEDTSGMCAISPTEESTTNHLPPHTLDGTEILGHSSYVAGGISISATPEEAHMRHGYTTPGGASSIDVPVDIERLTNVLHGELDAVRSIEYRLEETILQLKSGQTPHSIDDLAVREVVHEGIQVRMDEIKDDLFTVREEMLPHGTKMSDRLASAVSTVDMIDSKLKHVQELLTKVSEQSQSSDVPRSTSMANSTVTKDPAASDQLLVATTSGDKAARAYYVSRTPTAHISSIVSNNGSEASEESADNFQSPLQTQELFLSEKGSDDESSINTLAEEYLATLPALSGNGAMMAGKSLRDNDDEQSFLSDCDQTPTAAAPDQRHGLTTARASYSSPSSGRLLRADSERKYLQLFQVTNYDTLPVTEYDAQARQQKFHDSHVNATETDSRRTLPFELSPGDFVSDSELDDSACFVPICQVCGGLDDHLCHWPLPAAEHTLRIPSASSSRSDGEDLMVERGEASHAAFAYSDRPPPANRCSAWEMSEDEGSRDDKENENMGEEARALDMIDMFGESPRLCQTQAHGTSQAAFTGFGTSDVLSYGRHTRRIGRPQIFPNRPDRSPSRNALRPDRRSEALRPLSSSKQNTISGSNPFADEKEQKSSSEASWPEEEATPKKRMPNRPQVTSSNTAYFDAAEFKLDTNSKL